MPVRILWGEKDPWEPIKDGRKYADFACVDEFVPLPDAGHCPMDQVPKLVNEEVLRFIREQKNFEKGNQRSPQGGWGGLLASMGVNQ